MPKKIKKKKIWMTPDQIMRTIADAVNEYFTDLGIRTGFGILTWNPDRPTAGNIIIHGNQQAAMTAMRSKLTELQIKGDFPEPINNDPI